MMDEMPPPSQYNGTGAGPASSDNENPQDGESLVKMEKSVPNPAPAKRVMKPRIKAPESHMVAYEDILGVADNIKDLLNLLVSEHSGETLEDSVANQYKRFPRVNYSM